MSSPNLISGASAFVESSLSVNNLFNEATGALAALPPTLRNAATKMANNGWAGENSKIDIIGSGAKDFGTLQRLLKKAVLNIKSYVLVWVEVNGEFLAGARMIGSDAREFNLIMADGARKGVTQQDLQRGTGKWDRKINQYIPPRYYEYQRTALKSTEVGELLYKMIYEMYLLNKEAYGEDVDKFIKSASFDVKGLTVDTERMATRVVRKDTNAPGEKNQLAKDALKKLVRQKLEPLIADVQTAIPKIDDVMSMIDGQYKRKMSQIDTSALAGKIQKISQIVDYANDAVISLDYGKTTRYNWVNDGKPALNDTIKRLFDKLKEI